ncbi:hypothetical protein R3P38DRAFT_2814654 [Favolaschia claudopus]|uniref:F-box protein n=1 Tax=Favolaschia claudopus TaxID=2862362 RepID=A0AAV9Z332_9AGAR
METPQLWSNIVLDTRLWEACAPSDRILLRRLKSSLHRGQTHPLAVRVGAENVRGAQNDAIELLCKHSHRWRSASLVSCTPPNNCFSATMVVNQLESLALQVTGWKGTKFFLKASRLTALTLTNMGFDDIPDLPWDQIQSCCSSMPKSIFCKSPSLFYASQSLPVRLSDPSVLGIYGIFPSLHMEPPVFCSEHFLAFADRSAFAEHLLRLSIHPVVTGAELILCLKALPLLQELVVYEHGSGSDHAISDDVLQCLVYKKDDSGSSLIPSLKFLDLTSDVNFTDSKMKVVGQLEFRANLWRSWGTVLERDVSALLVGIDEMIRKGGFVFHSDLGT